MSLPQFIRDNTNDGRNIASVLIDVMEGRLDGARISHRLTAARLLTIYGHEDADDFIVENSSDISDREWGERMRVSIDPVISSLIKLRTDGGRAICLFLIDVMEGRGENIHVGHHVAAAKELLNRAFGKSRSRDLPKPPGSNSPRRQTHKTHQRVAPAQTQAVATAPAASTAVLDEPERRSQPETNGGTVNAPDSWLAVYDSGLYEFMNECEDPDFDPYRAAIDEEYFRSYTGCKNPECEVHGEPLEFDFDPNDFYY